MLGVEKKKGAALAISALIVCTVVVLAASRTADAPEKPEQPWLNWSLSVDERVESLIKAMTLEEKAAQLQRDTPRVDRLGLPKYHWRNNILHGPVDNGVSTMFPQAIALAATFDRELMLESAKVWAEEQRAIHNKHQGDSGMQDSAMNFGLNLWGPNINMFMHPLWGRGQETYGEDPFLAGQLAVEVVKGLQQSKDGVLKTIVTPKHFAAYTIDKTPPRLSIYEDISKEQLRQYYLPAFKAVVAAGAGSIMCSYNGINTTLTGDERDRFSTPMCMSPMLQHVLREEMGFGGFVVSDTGAISYMKTKFHRYDTLEEAASHSIKAGCDLNSGSVYGPALVNAVKAGMLEESVLDTSLRRVLGARVQLGLLNPAHADPYSKIPKSVLNSEPHRKVALRAAQSSMVLLKNEDGILPLRPSSTNGPNKRLAVIGPAAKDVFRMASNYYGCSWGSNGPLLPECGVQSPLEGITDALEGKGWDIKYALGVEQESDDESGIPEAEDLARDSDVVVAVIGLWNCSPHRWDKRCEAEGKDRPDIELPGKQHELLKRLHATGKPLVIVLSTGSPVAFSWEAENAKAILVNWYGGTLGGRALGDILTGAVSPSGRLPVSFVTNKQIAAPLSMDLRDGPGRTYQYLKDTPQYAFGLGLSYTSFSYDQASVQSVDDTAVCVSVTNDGKFDKPADEVVQLFARFDGDQSVPSRPKLVLAGFTRVRDIAPGETRRVCVPLNKDALGLVAEGSQDLRVLPGPYTLFIGGRMPGPTAKVDVAGTPAAPLEVTWQLDDGSGAAVELK